MSYEQIAVWLFALTAAHVYQFLKKIAGLTGLGALWGLYVYAFLVSILATIICGGFAWPPPLDPLLALQWLGTHIGPIVALATALYKGFAKMDEDTGKRIPGLGLSRI